MNPVLFFGIFVCVTAGAGWTLLDRIVRQDPMPVIERILLSYCLGSILLYFEVFAVGAFRYDRVTMAGVLVGTALVAFPSAKKAFAVAEPSVRSTFSNLVGFVRINPVAALLWAISAAIVALSLVEGLAPPSDGDSLNYHLGIPQRDLEQGVLGPDWAAYVYAFFPALSEHLYRLALALSGPQAAQLVAGSFGPLLALATVQVAKRLGYGEIIAALAVLMVVGLRVVVWEMGTCYVELALTVFTMTALLTLMRLRENGSYRNAVLFGLMVGGGVLVKYHGLAIGACFAAILMWDLKTSRLQWSRLLAAGLVAVVLLVPHSLRNIYYTGNPLFPLFNRLFHPDGPIFLDIEAMFGRGRSLLDFLRMPWDISIFSTYYFDGMQLGSPYLLAFLPLAWLTRRTSDAVTRIHALTLTSFALLYAVCWFWLLSQQVRFLVIIAPILAIFAAAGVVGAWQQSRPWSKAVLCLCGIFLFVNQSFFIAAYAATRLPASLGLVDAERYLMKTPGLDGVSYYGGCSYLTQHLQPNQTAILMLEFNSYYCPHKQAIEAPNLPEDQDWWLVGRPLDDLSAAQLATEFERHSVRFVMVAAHKMVRGGATSKLEEVEFALDDRMGRRLRPLLPGIEPVYRDAISSIYDGTAVIAALRQADANH